MARIRSGWFTFDHIADIGVRGIGESLEEAFENGAKALFSLLVDDISSIERKITRQVKCQSFDEVGLFVAWLNTLLAMSDLHTEVYNSFSVKISGLELSAEIMGEPWDKNKHGIGIEVKGATFSEAKVIKKHGFYIAQCIVDV